MDVPVVVSLRCGGPAGNARALGRVRADPRLPSVVVLGANGAVHLTANLHVGTTWAATRTSRMKVPTHD